MKMRMRAAFGGVVVGSLMLSQAHAQTQQEKADLAGMGTVSTHAEARTRLPNTVADVTLGIETTGRDVAGVTRDLGTRSNDLMGYLRGLGSERLQTGQVSVSPQNHTAKSGEQSIAGYTGNITVSFRIASDKLGDAITGALGHGANQVQQTNLTQRETETDTARRMLAVEATKTAIEEAKAVATAAGEKVFAVKSVQVGYTGGPIRPMMYAMRAKSMMMEAAAPVATEAGDAEVTVTVDVTLTVVRQMEK